MTEAPCTVPAHMSWMTLADAKYAYHSGRVTQDAYDAYRCAWQLSTPRFAEYHFAHDRCVAAQGDKS